MPDLPTNKITFSLILTLLGAYPQIAAARNAGEILADFEKIPGTTPANDEHGQRTAPSAQLRGKDLSIELKKVGSTPETFQVTLLHKEFGPIPTTKVISEGDPAEKSNRLLSEIAEVAAGLENDGLERLAKAAKDYEEDAKDFQEKYGATLRRPQDLKRGAKSATLAIETCKKKPTGGIEISQEVVTQVLGADNQIQVHPSSLPEAALTKRAYQKGDLYREISTKQSLAQVLWDAHQKTLIACQSAGNPHRADWHREWSKNLAKDSNPGQWSVRCDRAITKPNSPSTEACRNGYMKALQKIGCGYHETVCEQAPDGNGGIDCKLEVDPSCQRLSIEQKQCNPGFVLRTITWNKTYHLRLCQEKTGFTKWNMESFRKKVRIQQGTGEAQPGTSVESN